MSKKKEEEWTMKETEETIEYMCTWKIPVSCIIWSRDFVGHFFFYGLVNSILIDLSEEEVVDNKVGLDSQVIAMAKGWAKC